MRIKQNLQFQFWSNFLIQKLHQVVSLNPDTISSIFKSGYSWVLWVSWSWIFRGTYFSSCARSFRVGAWSALGLDTPWFVSPELCNLHLRHRSGFACCFQGVFQLQPGTEFNVLERGRWTTAGSNPESPIHSKRFLRIWLGDLRFALVVDSSATSPIH